VQNGPKITLLTCASDTDKFGENIARSVKEIVLNVYKDTVDKNNTHSYQVTRARLAVSYKTCYQISQINVHRRALQCQ
jgi:5S rRNA maturation endonuclease (ribonuclease M5)